MCKVAIENGSNILKQEGNIIVVHGNILNAEEHIICHQVNCKGVMNAALAKQIRDKWKQVYLEYMGLFTESTSSLLGSAQLVPVGNVKYVANLFGQYNYGRNPLMCYTNYRALKNAFINVKQFAVINNYSVAIPYGIGCGLANGDWEKVYKIILEVFLDSGVNVTLYKLG